MTRQPIAADGGDADHKHTQHTQTNDLEKIPMMRTMMLAAVTAAFANAAFAHDYTAGTLEIDHPWARATPPGAPVAGGYMTITNSGTDPDRLVGGSAPFAGRVEIHEMAVVDGVMRMNEIAGGLAIAPGETVTLAPGGYHVMFMELSEPLVEGEMRPATLVFENAGEVEVELAIEAMGAQRHDHGAHDHGAHDHGNAHRHGHGD